MFAKLFKRLAVLSRQKSTFYLLNNVVKILMRYQNPFCENLFYFDIAGEL